ncbi:hypothetical protein Droror1_Dr00027121 [Drosera rotundifolia]
MSSLTASFTAPTRPHFSVATAARLPSPTSSSRRGRSSLRFHLSPPMTMQPKLLLSFIQLLVMGAEMVHEVVATVGGSWSRAR